MKKRQVSSRTTLFMVQSALIAAVYVAVTLAVAPIAFGPVQFRISEALAVLPCFTPAAVPGLFVGCLLANSLAGSIVPDVVFGSLATLIGALASYGLRKHKFLVCVPPILSNVLIVPWVLHYGYGYPDAIPWLMLTVGIGEVLAVGGLGNLLLVALDRYKNVIFRSSAV